VNPHFGQQRIFREEPHYVLAVCVHSVRDDLRAWGSGQAIRERLGAFAVAEDRDNVDAGTVEAQLATKATSAPNTEVRRASRVEERCAPLT